MPGKDLFGEDIKYEEPKGKRNKGGGYIENPMHEVFGKNENERCKNCIIPSLNGRSGIFALRLANCKGN